MFETLIQDLRHGLRMLVKNPGFSLVAIASIAVGVAACARCSASPTAWCCDRCQCRAAADVVTINGTAPDDGGRGTGLSYLAYQDLRNTARSFTGMGAHRVLATSFALRREDQAESRLGFASAATCSTCSRCGRSWGASSAPTRIRWPAATPWR
jgi:hypothetical protein